MGDGPRILFGVGATKAGTSWLHRWLADHPDCHFRTVKELHYWNALEEGRVPQRVEELGAEAARLRQKGLSPRRLADIEALREVFRNGARPDAYLGYLSQGRDGKTVVGDVTPAYGLLPAERLREMAGLGDTRFLYILRDPVARLLSHAKMVARWRDPEHRVTPDRVLRILRRAIGGGEDEIARRSDYRGAIERIVAAVPAGRRLFVFFEDLFSGDAAWAICDFLGIRRAPALAEVVHGGPQMALSLEQAREARDWLRDQYDYVEGVMGRLPDAWRQAERI